MYRQLRRMSRSYGSPYTTSQAWGEHRIEIAVIGTEIPQEYPVVARLAPLWRFRCLRGDMQIWF